jgi:hypothetical protein
MPSQVGDRYEIESELGRGAASVVYLARDRALERRVALKVLPHYLAEDPGIVRRFTREAALVARLLHPNIITIFDFGQAGDDFYIAMEYVEGQSLARLLRANPEGVAAAEAVRIATQLAEALQYAHAQGVIHRDLKPGNVLLDAKGGVKLTDFGLALVTGGSAATVTAAQGMIVGTPGYLAPEIIQGLVPDPRVDIYALGAVLYQLLSGRRPFEADTPVATLFKALSETPPRPSTLRADIPSTLDDIVLKALAPQPAERFPSAAALIAALSQYSGALSVEDNWPAWVWSLRRLLLINGQLRAADIAGLLPTSYVAYAVERFAREETDLACLAVGDGLEIAKREPLLRVNEAFQALRARSEGAPPLRELLAWRERPAPDFADLLVHVIQQLATVLDAPFTPLGGEVAGRDVFPTSFSLDTRRTFAGTKLPGVLPVLFSLRGDLEESDLTTLRSCLSSQTDGARGFGLLVEVGSSEAKAVRERCDQMRRVYGTDVVVLGRRDVRRVLAARDPARVLRKAVFAQVNLSAVSPFVTNGPVSSHVFFGREDVLHDVVSQAGNASFAVVGGRRIGKSSLLARLHHDRLPAAGFQTLYHDCSTTPTFEEFRAGVARSWKPPYHEDRLPTFAEILAQPPPAKPRVLLLDEADKLIPGDRAGGRWPLFSALRALTHSGNTQVILSGERTLTEAMRDPTGPLFNFVNLILLGRLECGAVHKLVTAPLAELEIQLADPEETVRRIWAFTSGHPNVVQRLCRRLVERVNDCVDRTIGLDDLHQVLDDPAFQESDFLETYWERATPLERIISLLMAQDSRPRRLQAVLDLLAAEGLTPAPELVRAALERLVELRSLLNRGPEGYDFAVEAFPRVVRNAVTREDQLIVQKSLYLNDPADRGK